MSSARCRSRRSFLNRPSSEEAYPLCNRPHSYSEPMCLSAGLSPVTKTPVTCKSSPYLGFFETGDPVKPCSTPQSLKKKKCESLSFLSVYRFSAFSGT